MTTTSTRPEAAKADSPDRGTVDAGRYKPFAALAGVTSLLIILQGLWAGIFLSQDPRPDSWVQIHDMGAWATLAFAVLTAAYATWRLRVDKPLWIGAVVMALLLAGEAHLGGMITDNGDDKLTIIHVPLAMALLALSVWLPMRSRAARKAR